MKVLIIAEETTELIYLYHDLEFKQFILDKSWDDADAHVINFFLLQALY